LLILLVAVAAALGAAALVLPRIIDPNLLRDKVVADLQAALGRPLTVRGNAELAFLPTPTLTISQLAVGRRSGEGNGPLIDVDRVDLGLTAGGLLGVQDGISSARLVRPRVAIKPGDLPMIAEMIAGPQGGPSRIELLDGILALEGASGRPEQVEQLLLELRRPAEGPLTLNASGRWRGHPLLVNGDFVPVPDGSSPLRLELSIGSEGSVLTAFADGVLQPGDVFAGQFRLASREAAAPLALAVDLAGHPAAPEARQLGALSVEGRVSEADGVWQLDLSRASLGGTAMAGSARFDRARAQLTLAVDGTTLTLTPELIDWARGFVPAAVAPRGVQVGLDLRFLQVEWAGDAIRDVRLAAELGGNGVLQVQRLAGRLPGGGDVAVGGTGTRAQSGWSWTGDASLSLPDLPAVAGWLDLRLPQVAPDRLRTLTGRARIEWQDSLVTLRDLDLLVDATRLRGSVSARSKDRPQLAAALSLDRLVLSDYLPDARPADLGAFTRDLLRDRDLAMDLTVESLGWRELRAAGVHLDVEVTAGRLTLHELNVADLEEASGKIVGTGDLSTGALNLALDARLDRPARLLRALGWDPPATVGRFAPIEVSGTLDGSDDLLRLELDATAPGLTLNLTSELPPSLAEPAHQLHVALRAPSAAGLLEQLGFSGHSGTTFGGPVEIDADLNQLADGTLRLGGEAAFGANRWHGSGILETRATPPRITGNLTVGAMTPEVIMLGYDAGELGLGWPPGPPSRWPGAWPSQPIGTEWLRGVDLDVALDWDAGERHGTGKLGLSDGRLELLGLDLPLAGGWASGRIDLDGSGPELRLSTQSRLEGADFAQLLPMVGLRDGVTGQLDLDLSVQTGGASVSGLIAGLSGEARIRLRDGVLQGVRLLPSDDPLVPDETPFESIAGWLTLDRGSLVGDALSMTTSAGTSGLGLRLDLSSWQLEATLASPTGEGEPIHLTGRPGSVTPAGSPSPP
jgi:hypothetical protein